MAGSRRQQLPFAVAHLDHIVLRVRDSPAVVEFYTAALGATIERQLDIGLVQLRIGACLLDIVRADSELGRAGGAAPPAARPGTDKGGNLDHFCLRITPFEPDVIRAHLELLGARPSAVKRVYGAQGIGPSIYAQDPEGNRFELKGPPDQDQSDPAAGH